MLIACLRRTVYWHLSFAIRVALERASVSNDLSTVHKVNPRMDFSGARTMEKIREECILFFLQLTSSAVTLSPVDLSATYRKQRVCRIRNKVT